MPTLKAGEIHIHTVTTDKIRYVSVLPTNKLSLGVRGFSITKPLIEVFISSSIFNNFSYCIYGLLAIWIVCIYRLKKKTR